MALINLVLECGNTLDTGSPLNFWECQWIVLGSMMHYYVKTA